MKEKLEKIYDKLKKRGLTEEQEARIEAEIAFEGSHGLPEDSVVDGSGAESVVAYRSFSSDDVMDRIVIATGPESGTYHSLGVALEVSIAGGEWLSIGPYGGIVQSVALDPASPDILYAAPATYPVYPFVFKSTDGGGSWRRLGSMPVYASICSLAMPCISILLY